MNVSPKTSGSGFDFKRYGSSFIAIALFLVVSMVALSNLYIVKPNEYKLVRQFGEVVRVIDEPGLNYKLPIIQSITSLPKHLLIYDVAPAEINTFDKKRIMVDHYAVWKITSPRSMIETLRTMNAAEGRLGDIIYSNIRTELGRLNYDEIINEEKGSRGNINDLVRTQVNNTLLANSNGIEVVDIRMKRTDLPASNEQAVFNRMISERESTAQQYLSQGDAEATKIKAETDREVQEMIATANAEAKIIISQGENEAARIYNDSYGKDPNFYELYRTLESYRTTLRGEPVIILPLNSPYAKFLRGN
ncbi:protease modulator HflC [Desulfuribacillus stibiiarsenatis]|uniref:Protein HflC n=1 Tax=Desulfuribacillus stibiiarsenatis TaxID=1390249 RepID=A0A1E5L8B3_9FIRM|nr:protease modulator HflC [Desulfuribacillus stibiiarsenatis]